MSITIQDMADNILRNLEKNGFPANSVALPLERLYESAHNSGLNFNKVLDLLAGMGISNTKNAAKIVFSKTLPAQSLEVAPEMETDPGNPFSGFNFDALKKMDFSQFDLKGLNMGSMMSKASEMMKNMSPSQLAEIKTMYDKMSPEERAQLVNKVKSAVPK
jgi:hypothetical protein